MPVRLLRPYGGQPVGTLYFSTDEDVLRATGNADDNIEDAIDYAPSTRYVTTATANVSRTARTYYMNSATPQTITVGMTGYLKGNEALTFIQQGAGAFTLVAGPGVTILTALTSLVSKGVNNIAQLVKHPTLPNTFEAFGGLGG